MGNLIAQALLVALEIYRIHYGKGADWMPSAQDWEGLKAEVGVETMAKIKADAAARAAAGDNTEGS